MRVLDATFLIDYGNGVDSAGAYLLGHDDERFVVPSPVFVDYLLGAVHSSEPTNIDVVKDELAWTDVVDVDEETALTAAEVADEISPEGPTLAAVDALVAAIGREFDAPVVSADGDLTHLETKAVIDVEEYR